jgi:hypothetical protein
MASLKGFLLLAIVFCAYAKAEPLEDPDGSSEDKDDQPQALPDGGEVLPPPEADGILDEPDEKTAEFDLDD